MSEGLPGKLTFRHIEMAEERGDNYIYYKHVNYPLSKLKEMYNGSRIGRAKQKPKVSENIRGRKPHNSDGVEPELSGNERKE